MKRKLTDLYRHIIFDERLRLLRRYGLFENAIMNYSAVFFLTLAGIWLVIFMHIPFYNLDGSGFALSKNIATRIVVAFSCGGILLFNFHRNILATPYPQLLWFKS